MRENENKISRFDFPVFYAVLTYGMFLKNKTQEKVCALLFVGGTPDSGRYFSKKEYTGVEESDWLTFEKKAVSGHVRGERFYESYYKHLQMLFNAWEKPEGTALGKAEVKWRLEEIFKGTEPQAVMNVATNMLKVLDNCEIKNIQKTKENIYSEDKNYIQRKENDEKVFKERKAIYLSIKTKVREYYDNSKWLDSLAEAFRLAFVFTDNVDGKRFIKYSSEDFSKLKAILESVLNSFTGFKTWEDNTSIRKKLQHGCKNSCASLPKQTLLLIPIYLSSGRKSSEYSDTENAEFLPTFLRKRISQAKALPFDEVVKDYTERFCLLLGPGGAGKTTALSNFMKDYVANIQDNTHETNGTLLKDMIPVYLDLSAAPDTNCFLYREGKSTFIRRAVYHYMHSNEDKGSLPALNDWYPWDDTSEEEAFNDESNLLLLLDGLNEVSRTVLDNGKYTDKSIFQMICEEIKYLVWKNKCRKIVLISRTADGFLFTSDESVSPVLYDFCELDDTTIQETLGKYAGFFTEESQKEIESVMGNPTLRETLRRPLFLSMYCHLKGTDASTAGELLRIFFHERRDALYTIQERNAQIEKAQRSRFADTLKNTLTAEQQAFILDFILPAVAWNMGERFWINTAEADTIIQAVLEDKSETSVRGYAGIRAFTKYHNQNDSFRKTRYTAETLKNLGFKSSGEFESYTMVERMTEYCVSLGVLELDSNTQRLRFTQQIYRDYFVCAYVTNTFRIAEAEYEMAQESSSENQEDKAFECLYSLLGEKPLFPVVRHMIGESLGEHRNGPYYGDDKKWHYYTERNIESSLRGLTEKMLDICRGRYGEKLGYTVFNLLNIIAEVRPNRDLSGINLNGLDLRKYNLIGTRFAHPDLYATFVDSRVNLYPNCREDINHMVFNAKCSHFLTYGESGRLYIWDAKTLICTDSISAHNGKIYDLKFSSDSNFFYTIGEDNLIKEWSVADYTCVRQTELASETIRYAVLLCHPLNEKVYIFTSNIERERSWIDVYIYNKPLTERIDVQKLDVLDIADYAQSIYQVAFSTKGEKVILKTSITSYLFGKVDTTFYLFDLDQKDRIKTNENVWVTDFNEFDSGIYCEKSDFLLMKKKGVLKKWNIHTHTESVVSDSFTESLVHAHYNERRKIYILETDTRVLETDTLDSLQNSIPMNLPDYVSILWCGDSPYVGLLHDTCVEMWNMQATSSVGCFFTSLEKCCCMDVSEDGMHLVIASNDGTLNLFNKIDVKNYTCIDILTGVFDKNLITIHNIWWMREDEILVYSYPEVYRVRLNSNEGATLVLSLANYTSASSCAFIWRLFGTRAKYDKEQNRIYFDVSDKSKKNEKVLMFVYKEEVFQPEIAGVLSDNLSSIDVNPDRRVLSANNGKLEFMLQEDGAIDIFDKENDLLLQHIPNNVKLFIRGVDLSRLKDSYFTREEREILQLYGAIINDAPESTDDLY